MNFGFTKTNTTGSSVNEAAQLMVIQMAKSRPMSESKRICETTQNNVENTIVAETKVTFLPAVVTARYTASNTRSLLRSSGYFPSNSKYDSIDQLTIYKP